MKEYTIAEIKDLMKVDPWNFSLSSDNLKEDFEFVKYALSQHIGNIQFVSPNLFNNPTFMKYLITTYTPYFTEYGTFEYSWEYTGSIKTEYPYNFMITPGEEIFSNKDFLKSIIISFPWALDFVPERLKNDLNFIKDIAILNKESYIYLDEKIIQVIQD